MFLILNSPNHYPGADLQEFKKKLTL